MPTRSLLDLGVDLEVDLAWVAVPVAVVDFVVVKLVVVAFV